MSNINYWHRLCCNHSYNAEVSRSFLFYFFPNNSGGKIFNLLHYFCKEIFDLNQFRRKIIKSWVTDFWKCADVYYNHITCNTLLTKIKYSFHDNRICSKNEVK